MGAQHNIQHVCVKKEEEKASVFNNVVSEKQAALTTLESPRTHGLLLKKGQAKTINTILQHPSRPVLSCELNNTKLCAGAACAGAQPASLVMTRTMCTPVDSSATSVSCISRGLPPAAAEVRPAARVHKPCALQPTNNLPTSSVQKSKCRSLLLINHHHHQQHDRQHACFAAFHKKNPAFHFHKNPTPRHQQVGQVLTGEVCVYMSCAKTRLPLVRRGNRSGCMHPATATKRRSNKTEMIIPPQHPTPACCSSLAFELTSTSMNCLQHLASTSQHSFRRLQPWRPSCVSTGSKVTMHIYLNHCLHPGAALRHAHLGTLLPDTHMRTRNTHTDTHAHTSSPQPPLAAHHH